MRAAAGDGGVAVADHHHDLRLRIELVERAEYLERCVDRREHGEDGAWLVPARGLEGGVVDCDPRSARVANHDGGQLRVTEPRQRCTHASIEVRERIRATAEIGRASCRERGESEVVAVTVK